MQRRKAGNKMDGHIEGKNEINTYSGVKREGRINGGWERKES